MISKIINFVRKRPRKNSFAINTSQKNEKAQICVDVFFEVDEKKVVKDLESLTGLRWFWTKQRTLHSVEFEAEMRKAIDVTLSVHAYFDGLFRDRTSGSVSQRKSSIV